MALPVHSDVGLPSPPGLAVAARDDGLRDALEGAIRPGRRPSPRSLAADALRRGLNCAAPIRISGVISNCDFQVGNEIVFQSSVKLHDPRAASAASTDSLADAEAPSTPAGTWRRRGRAACCVAALVAMSTVLVTVLVLLLQGQPGSSEAPRPKGLTLVRRQQWQARPPRQQEPRLRGPVGVVAIQHSSGPGCSSQARCMDRVQEIQDLHIDVRNFSDIGYNLLVGGDGAVYEGRGWDTQGASVLGWNNRSLAVCFMGDYRLLPPTARMRDALFKVLALLVDLGKVAPDYKLAGACQLTSSRHSRHSPGLRFMQDLKGWRHWWDYYDFEGACTFLD